MKNHAKEDPDPKRPEVPSRLTTDLPVISVDLEGTLDIPTYRLEELLARITPQNQHAEVDWGAPVGREII